MPACIQCTQPLPAGARFCGECGTPASPATPPPPPVGRPGRDPARGGPVPRLPARYEVVDYIARGGMGRVYECRDTRLGVTVAVKVLPPDVAADPDAVAQIEKEAKEAVRFRDHPHILTLLDFDAFEGTHFLVMQFAAGGSLHDRIRMGGPLPEAACRRLGAEMAHALAFAHRLGVMHRDIKPANVLLDGEGRALVADFGIAKAMADAASRRSVVDGSSVAMTVAGTSPYMAPEMLAAKPRYDHRVDLYALGCVLFEMATGRRAFEGDAAGVFYAKTLPDSPVPDPGEQVPDLSEGYRAVTRRLLARDPEDRYPDAESVAAALRGLGVVPAATRAAAGTGTGGTVKVGSPAAPPRRGGWKIAAGIAGGIALAAAVAMSLPGKEEPKPEGGGATKGAPHAPPPAESGGLLVVTTPPGASVTVDGKARGTAGAGGLLLSDLVPGRAHAVKAWLDGYEPAEQSGVTFDGKERREVRLSLRALSGFLRIEGGPAGAAVRLQRKGQPARDLVLAEDGALGPVPVEAGEWTLAVTAKGFHPVTRTVKVAAGRTTTEKATLLEKEGTLALDTDPPGAEVFSGTTLLGTTPLRPRTLKAGSHTLRLVHPEREEVAREVVVRGEEALDLGRIPLPALAILDLSGLASGVRAFVDGVAVSGRVARRSGAVRVELQRDGFRAQVATVTLRSGAATGVTVGEWRPLPGRLDLSAVAGDAEVSVDGVVVNRRAPVEAEPGERRIAFSRKGFRPVEDQRVMVAAGEVVRVADPAWVALGLVTPAVPGLPPPPEAVLVEQRKVALPAGFVRDDAGRIWCEKDGAEMVLVPAGEFTMGDDSSSEADEKPAHRVFVSGFLVDRHEVTVGQFKRFCAATGKAMPAQGSESTDRHPVVSVDWNEAVEYCKWAGKRLPTEAEFEKCLRGGMVGAKYPWGNSDRPVGRPGNYADMTAKRANPLSGFVEGYDDGHELTAPAGSFDANAMGLFDVSGNVWEWCADWYDAGYYKTAAARGRDPTGPATGSARSARGGSWVDLPARLRCAFRFRIVPRFRFEILGFRSAVGLP